MIKLERTINICPEVHIKGRKYCVASFCLKNLSALEMKSKCSQEINPLNMRRKDCWGFASSIIWNSYRFITLSHWGGPDPVDEEEKDYLAKNVYL